jgi:hypothetical protein
MDDGGFYSTAFGYRGSATDLGCACKKLGALGPMVWEEIENPQTVVNSKVKFIYRLDLFSGREYSRGKKKKLNGNSLV